MKRFISFILVITTLLTVCTALTSCDNNSEAKVYYVESADFFYSTDKGKTYGNGKKEYAVGETIYMQVKVRVTSDSDIPEPIKLELTIPNITALTATYFDGQPITPFEDTINNVTIYEFTIPTNGPENAGKFIFEFIPNSEATATMTLKFDEKLDSMYDKQNTIRFVDANGD